MRRKNILTSFSIGLLVVGLIADLTFFIAMSDGIKQGLNVWNEFINNSILAVCRAIVVIFLIVLGYIRRSITSSSSLTFIIVSLAGLLLFVKMYDQENYIFIVPICIYLINVILGVIYHIKMKRTLA
ncbi:hypothetical protein [Brevibacillus laterosporus]|uniref:hypothetical protein n=1 Tax=Brevibacillus laterosporus TaxID=1465 RepID=UPI000E6D02B7|nr:hypothetical protein [Brevibacillus laterosporus]AYB38155.1 hypothetical protein D5F52_07605 [Brevibacillus laterosporus]MBM7111863.1 hypothetical protein [Brevibacillus laterosporus]